MRHVGAAQAFAPSNIALCKYWGKRNALLNLPVTSSLSLSLGALGSTCRLEAMDGNDTVTLDGTPLPSDHPFVTRLTRYLDLVRPYADAGYKVETKNTIPTAAGFASSASGFAAVVQALTALYGWELTPEKRSILARLGSGSAARSLWQGLVEWHAGVRDDGMDSFAEPLEAQWPDLRIGLLILEAGEKPIGSREAMQRTVNSSPLYRAWPETVATHLEEIKSAIETRDIQRLGSAAEQNALAMHATMIAASPPVLYWKPESMQTMQAVWDARREGVPVFLTMDAGPNIKLLFQAQDETAIRARFPNMQTATALD